MIRELDKDHHITPFTSKYKTAGPSRPAMHITEPRAGIEQFLSFIMSFLH
eukprot:gene22756-9185_t